MLQVFALPRTNTTLLPGCIAPTGAYSQMLKNRSNLRAERVKSASRPLRVALERPSTSNAVPVAIADSRYPTMPSLQLPGLLSRTQQPGTGRPMTVPHQTETSKRSKKQAASKKRTSPYKRRENDRTKRAASEPLPTAPPISAPISKPSTKSPKLAKVPEEAAVGNKSPKLAKVPEEAAVGNIETSHKDETPAPKPVTPRTAFLLQKKDETEKNADDEYYPTQDERNEHFLKLFEVCASVKTDDELIVPKYVPSELANLEHMIDERRRQRQGSSHAVLCPGHN